LDASPPSASALANLIDAEAEVWRCARLRRAACLYWPWVSEVIVVARLDTIPRAELLIPLDHPMDGPPRAPSLALTTGIDPNAETVEVCNPLRVHVSPSASPGDAAILRALARLAAAVYLPWRANVWRPGRSRL
jgi:hypothetical protein